MGDGGGDWQGLAHVCVTSLEASRGRHHQYARGPNVRRVALVLQEEATSPHAECLRAGPYTAGTTPRGHCSQVGNGVSCRRCAPRPAVERVRSLGSIT